MSTPKLAPNGKPLAEVYRQAAALVRLPNRWFQGAFAVTKNGNEVSWDDPEATAFCALGALFITAVPTSTAEKAEVALPLLSALVRAGAVEIYDDAEDERRPLAPGDDLKECLDELDEEDAIGSWNDRWGRTATEVADAFLRVAAELEGGAP